MTPEQLLKLPEYDYYAWARQAKPEASEQLCREFADAMQGKLYGLAERANAFAWFWSGWTHSSGARALSSERGSNIAQVLPLQPQPETITMSTHEGPYGRKLHEWEKRSSDKEESLIVRLRQDWSDPGAAHMLMREASDWIEQLERENLELRHDLDRAMANHNADLNAKPSSTVAPDPLTIEGMIASYRKSMRSTDKEFASPEEYWKAQALRLAADVSALTAELDAKPSASTLREDLTSVLKWFDFYHLPFESDPSWKALVQKIRLYVGDGK